jgi:RNA methyltransferase, TrmH family
VYCHLPQFFKTNTRKVYGAFLGGETLGTKPLTKNAVLIIGNEAKGISAETAQYVDTQITINGSGNAESLNASVAASILMYEILG